MTKLPWVADSMPNRQRAGGQETTVRAHITFVLEKRGDDWLVVQAHYSLA